MIEGARLSNKYWSYALLHTVYMKHRLSHKALTITLYQGYAGNIPDVSHLKVFDIHVTSKLPGDRRTKLAKNVTYGIFLGYVATNVNIIFQDSISNLVKRAHYVIFDEAFYHQAHIPPYT